MHSLSWTRLQSCRESRVSLKHLKSSTLFSQATCLIKHTLIYKTTHTHTLQEGIASGLRATCKALGWWATHLDKFRGEVPHLLLQWQKCMGGPGITSFYHPQISPSWSWDLTVTWSLVYSSSYWNNLSDIEPMSNLMSYHIIFICYEKPALLNLIKIWACSYIHKFGPTAMLDQKHKLLCLFEETNRKQIVRIHQLTEVKI